MWTDTLDYDPCLIVSSGHDPSKVFHRKVNKRSLPDYYEVIKEPVALSTLKSKLQNRQYRSFADFVRDCALIPHNAQTYNRPEAGAYQDALVIKGIMETEFQQLAEDGVIPKDDAILPDLGEIPPASPRPVEEDEDEEDEDDEDEEDEEGDESDEEGAKRKRRRGPRSSAAITKRDGTSKDDSQKGGDSDPRKRRGRPPRVDTPMEARIKAVLKGIRKHKNDLGHIMIHQFEKLPDKTAMPEYYQEIKEPIAIEIIKRKQKRKKYQSVDHFMRDINTMFNNAKSYNQDESQIYKDAVLLQVCAHSASPSSRADVSPERSAEIGRGGEEQTGRRIRYGRRSSPFTQRYIAQRGALESGRLGSHPEPERCDQAYRGSDLSYLAGLGRAEVGERMLVLPARTDCASVRKTFLSQ